MLTLMKHPTFFVALVLLIVGTSEQQKPCILGIDDNAHIGTVVNDSIQKFCIGDGTNVTEKGDNPYYYLNGTKLVLGKLIETDTPTVGNGTCHGVEHVVLAESFEFQCEGEDEQSCTITINPTDDFTPEFCNASCFSILNPIEIHLNESSSISYTVYKGSVCDQDLCDGGCFNDNIQVNDSLIQVNSDEYGTFTLSLNGALDYEVSKEHYIGLTIVSSGHQDVNITLVLHVEDMDDQSPVFTEPLYTCSLTEGKFSIDNRTNCTVKGFDQDIGINATLKYEVTSFYPEDVEFSIDDNGMVQVNGTIDRETNGDYMLGIMIYEEYHKKDRYNFTTVFIQVVDVDDNLPQFTQTNASVDIVENLNNGAVIYTPSAIDIDKGENAQFVFTMNTSSMFEINKTTGEITIKDSASIDREKYQNPLNLEIGVHSTKDSSKGNSMNLTITLLDVNDNNPVFTNESGYQATILKDIRVGEEVIQVNATDQDKGSNRNITYRLVSGTDFFSVNETTGVVTLKKLLKDSVLQMYEMYIEAFDNPEDPSFRRSSVAKVTITLTDVNIHAPDFTVNQLRENATENGDTGLVIALLNCTDLDWNDTLKVSFVDNVTKNKFNIFALEGTLYGITLIKQLDRETERNHTLKVQCTDGKTNHTRIETLSLIVLDQNDNVPSFNAPSILEIQENEAKTFNNFSAHDPDEGDNGTVNYSLVIPDIWKETVTIDQTTGLLNISTLDRENLVNNTLDFVIMAFDQGLPSLTASIKVKVHVVDANDNSPKFKTCCNKQIIYLKDEDVYNFTLQATDIDEGNNSKVDYKLLNVSNELKAAVHVTAGGHTTINLAAASGVDADCLGGDVFNFTVEAYNKVPYSYSNIRNGSQLFEVHFIDINDHSPTFFNSTYDFDFNETMKTGHIIGSVLASDCDFSRKYNTVYYSINASTDTSQDTFRIDEYTGDIYLNHEVDFDTEIKHTFKFEVLATDGQLNGTTWVTINVLPINDNKPVFDNDLTRCLLPENHQGSFNCTVQATDRDDDSTIHYKLVNVTKIFTINETTGEMLCNKSLDYDGITEHIYFLNISASDDLHVVYSMLVVELQDVNDEPPQFDVTTYTFNISENNIVDEVIGTVHVSDKDSENITFTLDDNSDFRISELGELHALNMFDRERNDSYTVTVTACDGQNNQSATIVVYILDQNDNVPEFVSFNTSLFINENQNQEIDYIQARDPDEGHNGTVNYSLVLPDIWKENVTIDQTTGLLNISTLDRENLVNNTLDFVIMAFDQGLPSLTATIKITVHVVDANDNSPKFKTCCDKQIIYLKDEDVYNFTLQATDIDEGHNSKVVYRLLNASNELKPAVNVTAGGHTTINLAAASGVDADCLGGDVFNFTVEAYNKIPYSYSNIRNGSQLFEVHFIDINDHSPTFFNSTYDFDFNETMKTGHIIGSVFASDGDFSRKYNTVYFSINASTDTSKDTFRIDKCTGDIYLNQEVDFDTEKNNIFKFEVVATDGQLNGTTWVTITVLPINDNKPVFDHDLTRCLLPENHQGSFNCTVQATDRDEDTTIHYKLVNVTKIFTINETTGEVLCYESLDYDDIPDHIYFLNISASDDLHVVYSMLVVELQDVNDEPPQFDVKTYTFNISENNIVDEVIGTVHVSDRDSENITFTLDDNSDFRISELGELYALNMFDRERNDSYTVTVTACDGQNNQSAKIVVYILDQNDNVPEFVSFNTSLFINENQNQEIDYIAHDPDKGHNGTVNYTLVLPDIWKENVTIDQTTGLLNISTLDRENLVNNTLDFVIMAFDQGFPSLTATIKVKVHVVDANDNSPKFKKCCNKQIIYLKDEDVYNFTLQATDIDEGNNSKVDYRLLNVSSELKAAVHVTAGGHTSINLTAASGVDADCLGGDVFNFTVEAYNKIPYSCSNIWNGSQLFEVHFIDINDHSPTFFNSTYDFDFNETMKTGHIIGSVFASDGDFSRKYNTIYYSINASTDTSKNTFRIDKCTGDIYLNQKVDVDTKIKDTFKFEVVATDGQLNGTTLVTITVLPINDNKPVFDHDLTRCILPENHQGSFNCTVQATDRDEDTTIHYKLVNVTEIFTINETTGEMLCNKSLDYDDIPEHIYFLNISASDDLHVVNSMLVVELQDVNDEPPQFDVTTFTFNISENNIVDEVIGTVHVSDRDSENITFTLDDNSDFRISELGDLYALNMFDRERHDSYTVTVTACDGQNNQSATIAVYILDQNDNVPKFVSFNTSLFINENQNQEIYYIEAHDPDKGHNGTVNYTLVLPDVWKKNVTIDQTTGLLNISTLDRENLVNNTLDFVIMAFDQGLPSLTATRKVKVHVVDANDNSPKFKKCCNNQIFYLKDEDVYNFKLQATDIDEGNNSQVVYRLLNVSNELEAAVHVTADGQTTINLTAASGVDADCLGTGVFNFTVEAYNKIPYSCPNIRNGSQLFEVHFIDINDHCPTFFNSTYDFDFNETMKTGHIIGSVFASDGDFSRKYNTVYYSINASTDTSKDTFRIDKCTGDIYLNQEVDFDTEKNNTFKFEVVATDGQLNGTTWVTITVLPINDNKPVFDHDLTRCLLPENHQGSFNCTVQATDRDEDTTIHYKLVNITKIFTVNETTGEMLCNKSLDYDGIPEHIYFVNISASDDLHVVYSMLVVELQDVNDEPPQFDVTTYTFNISENNIVDEVIGTVHVSDRDSENITFTLDDNSDFRISELGELHALNMFDRERNDSYTVTVTACDGQNNQSAKIIVHILDQNDNVPEFVLFNTSLFINENQNQEIYYIEAHDPDKGHNGTVNYSLVLPDIWKENVTIDQTTGLLNISTLDRENLVNNTLDFVIMAFDQGLPSLTATKKVKVHVVDANDNSPKFKKCCNNQIIYLKDEDVYNFTLQATDIDEGNNSKVDYRLLSVSSELKAAVHVTAGGQTTINLTAASGVDADCLGGDVFNFTVEAYNKIPYSFSNIRNGSQLFEVHFIDINDHSPTFFNSTYDFDFNETMKTGHIIGSVFASDGDFSRKYNTVYYSINASKDTSKDTFRIDQCSGDIYLNHEVDFDNIIDDTFKFEVVGTDGQLNGTAVVTITVLPINDNKPVFDNDLTRCLLPENHQGSFNCTVQATDRDEDTTIHYKLVNVTKIFTINETTGEMLCNKSLDYDGITEHMYFLNISASDDLHVVYSMLVVELQDVNDEPPQFDVKTYTFNISENNIVDEVIGTVHVSDRDSENITFTLDDNSDFHISELGEIHALNMFDRERNDSYTVTVTACDGQNNQSAKIVVYILDQNDNVPEFVLFNTSLFINENQTLGEVIFNVTAIDLDSESPNNDVEYTLVDGNKNDTFALNQTTGELGLLSMLNASVFQQFDLVIEATDFGSPPLRNITLLTIQINDENNNPPFFLYEPLQGMVPENSNSSVLKVHAMDPDLNNTLEFEVLNLVDNHCNLSFIEDNLYADFLDAEATANGTITCEILVTDGLHNVTANVTIQILDVNDNAPVFDETTYSTTVEINDTNPVGSSVMNISATDADISTRTDQILYLLDAESEYYSYFHIDYFTGEITVQGSLHNISGQFINMSVIARDAGSPSCNSTTNVSVSVKEVNAHPPVFNSTITVFPIKENELNFSGKINATDADEDLISFEIISGNTDIFTLNNITGLLSLTNKSFTFNFESKSDYELIIEATDNAHFPRSASTTVTVRVIDVNEKPTVNIASETVYRKVNTTVNNIITTVSVEDPDINSTLKEHSFDIIEVNPNMDNKSFFTIDGNGVIKVKEDLTQIGTFNITVQVTNIEINVSSQMIVIVSNVDGRSETYKISENSTHNILDHFVGNFTYNITTAHEGNFSIERNGTGFDLVCLTTFDYEKMKTDHSVHFSVEGFNNVTKTLAKQIQVEVKVLNINDNPPVFNSTHFHISIYENTTLGESIGLVTATDADGNLTELTYYVDTNDYFEIDEGTGSLQLLEVWDFDNTTTHQLTLQVLCNDTKFTTNTSVDITLLDVNDNGPVFTNTSYMFRLNESMSVGVVLKEMFVSAMDVDSMDIGGLTYTILPGDDGHYFTLDRRSGNFTLAEAIDYEQQQTLTFDVRVLDTALHNNTAKVTVTVLDINDNPPLFNQSTYSFTVKEGTNYAGDNFTISAYDLDSGMNGNLTFHLQNTNHQPFELIQEPDTDKVILHIQDLDRENPEVRHVNGSAVYTVSVIAVDHGTPPLSSSVLVSVYVEDINDCLPEFSQTDYAISVQEGVSIGQQIFSFTVTDCDYNPSFKNMTFNLSGQGHDTFKIKKVHGYDNVARITVANELDMHKQNTYNLTVSASDGRNNNSVNLTLTVLDTNDHAPNFTKPTYTFNVTEELDGGVIVGIVSATDDDLGINGNVTYSITSGNQHGEFSITTNYTNKTGLMTTNLKLDREERSEYVMIITAEDHAKKGRRQGTCTVTVIVEDINDNQPIFNTNSGYRGSITENSSPSTIVYIVPSISAVDSDSGYNGTDEIRYSLSGNGSQHFSINSTTGLITVKENIDREEDSFFDLQVVARDSKGGPGAQNSTANLTITVIDVNDCPPEFINSSYSFNAMENSNSGTPVGRVSVTDMDVSGTQHVRFRIIHGDDDKFYIDTVNASGIIHISGNIDRETKDIYTLIVTANDGRNEGNTTVTIHVDDINDNAPVFDNQSITVIIQENLVPPTTICRVTAKDNDEADTDNSRVIYSLESQPGFNISENGTILALDSLDRETQASYEIVVIAKDSGTPQMSGSMSVTITVGDVNDNSPQFFEGINDNLTIKVANIVEESPVNSVVAFIAAKDIDSGENGRITFFLVAPNGTDYFYIEQIDNLTAVVKIKKSIKINTLVYNGIVQKNFSESVNLNLTIVALDHGSNGASRGSNMTLSINVEPINDDNPVFLEPNHPFEISENSPVGTEVGHCEAVVINSTLSHLTYSLLDNRTKSVFTIDAENCTIRTRKKLDREKIDVFNFPVMVKDGRTPERTAFTAIQVIVTDKNDNPPVFFRPIIHLDLRENTSLSQPINVSAVDNDLGNNSVIAYSLTDTFDGVFSIDTSTGMLTIDKPLDYEQYSNFTIIIVGTDHGQKPLSASATVYVSVIDVNDNTPQFYYINDTVHVKENFIGEIFNVYANDSDSGLNGLVIYSIPSSSSKMFAIEQYTGAVFLVKALDFEEATSHTVEITASDQGSPALSSTVTITVLVDDDYDFMPRFDRDVYECNITRSAKVGQVVIDLNATDDMVKYAIKGSDTDYFGIDKASGVIKVSGQLDIQRSRYILTITATEQRQQHMASCTVIVMVTDHLIAFPHKEYHVDMVENVDKAFLVDLNTTEEINGYRVLYRIVRTEPETQNVFQIDEKGRLSCLQALDRETNSQYILYIIAQPWNARQKRDLETLDDSSTLVKLTVHVTDVNDCPPEFPVIQKRQFGVPRDARSSYFVTHIQAIDKDSPSTGGPIHYKFTDGAVDFFKIQETSGDIFVKRAIEGTRETQFNLTVVAFDSGDLTKNDTINIKIFVIENTDRLMLVTAIPVEEFRKNKEELIRNMSSVLGIDVQEEKVEAHREIVKGVTNVHLDRSDLYFHAINRTTGLPVSSADMMDLISSYSGMLNALFGEYNISSMALSPHVRHPSAKMGAAEIGLISVAVLIFTGGVVAILFALSTLKSMDQEKHEKDEDGIKSGLEDFELESLRGQDSSQITSSNAVAAINPAFIETEFNTSGQSSLSEQRPTEHESQEIRLEFGEEPIDANLPEAEVRGSLIPFPKQSTDSGVGNGSLSSHEILQSGSSGSDVQDNESTKSESSTSENGPVMTSSPKAVRFKVGDAVIGKDRVETENVRNAGIKVPSTQGTGDQKRGILKFGNEFGETETDDGIEADEVDDDDMSEDGYNDENNRGSAVYKVDDPPEVTKPGNSDGDVNEIEEITAF